MQSLSLTGLTQADGAQTFTLRANNKFTTHQLHVEVSAQPAAGTLSIAIKTPGASVASTLSSTVDMTAITATDAEIVDINAAAETITITPALFDADKTYNAILVSR